MDPHMDPGNVDRWTRYRAKLNHSTSFQPKKPYWQRVVRSRVVDYLIVFGGIQVSLLLLAFTFPKSLSAILVALPNFSAILVLFYKPFVNRELLWWLVVELRAWHARACVDILNWKHACTTFVKKLSIWTTDRRNDELKHFEWTCVSPDFPSKTELMCCGA